jgi:hypothetical protein
VLPSAPGSVELEFSESLDMAFTRAKLADADLNVLVEGPGRIDPDNDRILRLGLTAIPDGAYNFIWQARSAVDGHITNGVVTFSIGAAAPTGSLVPSKTQDPTRARPAPADTLLRWLVYIATAITAGSILFGLLVWRPAYAAWGTADLASDEYALGLLRQLAWLGIGGLAALSIGFLIYQAWQASRGTFQIPYLQALLALLDPRNGWDFWLRLILLGFWPGW